MYGFGDTSAPAAVPTTIQIVQPGGQTFWGFVEGTQGLSISDAVSKYKVLIVAGSALMLGALFLTGKGRA